MSGLLNSTSPYDVNRFKDTYDTGKTGGSVNYHDNNLFGIIGSNVASTNYLQLADRPITTNILNSSVGVSGMPNFRPVNSIVVKNDYYGIGGGSLFGCGCYGAGSVLGPRTFNALEIKNETEILNDVGFWDRQYANIINTCSTTEGTFSFLGLGCNFLGNLFGGDKTATVNNAGNAKVIS